MQLCIKGLLQSQQKQSTSPIKVILFISRSQTAAAFPSDLFVGGGTQKTADGIQFSAPESCNDGTMDAEAADHADQAHGCPYLLHPPTFADFTLPPVGEYQQKSHDFMIFRIFQ
jgi:hypothetical protein